MPGSVDNVLVFTRHKSSRWPDASNGFAVPKAVEAHIKVPSFPLIAVQSERKLRLFRPTGGLEERLDAVPAVRSRNFLGLGVSAFYLPEGRENFRSVVARVDDFNAK